MRGGGVTVERDAFLAGVRSALSTAKLPAVEFGHRAIVPDLPETDLVDLFVERASSLGVTVHLGIDPIEVIEAVAREHGAENYLGWDDSRVSGVDLSHLALNRIRHDVDRASLVEVALGITGAEAGFAESGSIAVRSGAGRSRLASVVPLVHVAVLRKVDIWRSLAHWSQRYAPSIAEAANVVFITGPSRTADIEQVLTVGVHGPRHVHIVLTP